MELKKSAIALQNVLNMYCSTYCKQYVQIDDISSSMLSINTGVPQGSIVGSLLFNIFINDSIISGDKFNFKLYVDHTMVESFGDTAADIQVSIRNELQQICR